MYPRRWPHPDRQAPPGYFGGPGGNPEDNVLVEEKEEEEGQAIGRFRGKASRNLFPSSEQSSHSQPSSSGEPGAREGTSDKYSVCFNISGTLLFIYYFFNQANEIVK